VSRDGNQEIAQLAASMLREVGLEPRLEPTEHLGVTHFNLVADVPAPTGCVEPRPPGLVLLTHLDTVPPGDPAEWTATGGDPFRPTRDGNRLYGLGSADAKVDLVCKAAALAEIDFDSLTRPIRVVGTFAEEIGLVGVRHFVRAGGTRGYAYAMVGEPSELVGIRAHKGYAVFEARIPLSPLPSVDAGHRLASFEVRGVSAHSSTPHLGANAIDAALERLAAPDVLAIAALEGGGAVNVVASRAELSLCLDPGASSTPSLELGGASLQPLAASAVPSDGSVYDAKPLVVFHRAWRETLRALAHTRDSDFDPDHTVGNLGRIELSEGRALLRFDLRPVPGVDLAEAIRPLEAVAEIELVRRNPALATNPDGVLVRAVREAQARAGLEPRIATKATCTEAGLIAEGGELEAVVLGAGLSVGNVHRPNEHTRISELEQARKLYRELITLLCTESGDRSEAR